MENSKISWTDHTFNPWIGCTKVSDGCRFCYAEELMSRRFGEVQWGPAGTRKRTSQANWRKPLQWNRQAWFECPSCGWRGTRTRWEKSMGVFACPTCDRLYPNPVRQRVFCASLADVFEDRPELEDWRRDLFDMVLATPHLDWLLLTKRPENIVQMTSLHNFSQGLPSNIWLGTSVENQETADERIPHLLKVPATVHFISMEPLLGPVDLGPALYKNGVHKGGIYYQRIDWIIVGGESGPNARPMHPEWVRSIRDQCIASGTPFHFKQWGEWMPCTAEEYAVLDDSKRCFWGPYIGLDGWRCGPLPRLWDGVAPKSIQITTMARVGKKAAGRLLGVQEWNEYPEEIAQ